MRLRLAGAKVIGFFSEPANWMVLWFAKMPTASELRLFVRIPE